MSHMKDICLNATDALMQHAALSRGGADRLIHSRVDQMTEKDKFTLLSVISALVDKLERELNELREELKFQRTLDHPNPTPRGGTVVPDKPWVVGRVDDDRRQFFATEAEADAAISTHQMHDAIGVAAGDYYIDSMNEGES